MLPWTLCGLYAVVIVFVFSFRFPGRARGRGGALVMFPRGATQRCSEVSLRKRNLSSKSARLRRRWEATSSTRRPCKSTAVRAGVVTLSSSADDFSNGVFIWGMPLRGRFANHRSESSLERSRGSPGEPSGRRPKPVRRSRRQCRSQTHFFTEGRHKCFRDPSRPRCRSRTGSRESAPEASARQRESRTRGCNPI